MASVWKTETKMGTYTTNYQLYMPSVGETGWGALVNGNFTTIDSTMKGLSNRITAVENEVNGNLSCMSVTASGKVTANGGIASTTGTFSGAVTGKTFNGVVLKSSGTITVTPNNTIKGYLHSNANYYITILPPIPNVSYTGSLRFYNPTTRTTDSVRYYPLFLDGTTGVNYVSLSVPSNGYADITFENYTALMATVNANGVQLCLCEYTFS